jgi:hypothetical protein
LIVLCREYGFLGIGIEQDGRRASLSQEVIARLDLSESIKIIEETISFCPLKPTVTFTWSLPRLNPKKRYSSILQKFFPKEVKSPTASTKKAFGEFWTVVPLRDACRI